MPAVAPGLWSLFWFTFWFVTFGLLVLAMWRYLASLVWPNPPAFQSRQELERAYERGDITADRYLAERERLRAYGPR